MVYMYNIYIYTYIHNIFICMLTCVYIYILTHIMYIYIYICTHTHTGHSEANHSTVSSFPAMLKNRMRSRITGDSYHGFSCASQNSRVLIYLDLYSPEFSSFPDVPDTKEKYPKPSVEAPLFQRLQPPKPCGLSIMFKIEGPVWYTHYHHLPVIGRVFPKLSITLW